MTIGFLMFVSIFALKYDYETLFQKHTQPQVDLEEIKDMYRVNLIETLTDFKEKQMSNQDTIEVVYLAQQIIHKQWDNYQHAANSHIGGLPYYASKWLSFFLLTPHKVEKTAFQQGIVEKISSKMQHLDQQMDTLLDLLKSNKNKEALVVIDDVILSANSLNIYLSSLITTHLKHSISEKQTNDSLFQTSTFMLILLIGLIFMFITMVLLIIINHFKNIHFYYRLSIYLMIYYSILFYNCKEKIY